MKTTPIATLAALVCACRSTPAGNRLELVEVHAQVEIFGTAIGDVIAGYGEFDPSLAETLEPIHEALGVVDANLELVLAGGAETLDLYQSIDLALQLLAPITVVVTDDLETQARVRGLAIAARLVLLELRLVLGRAEARDNQAADSTPRAPEPPNQVEGGVPDAPGPAPLPQA
jgi:hypothetical protein